MAHSSSRWPECRSFPAASGDDLGVRSESGRSWLRRLRRVRSSPMSPDAPLFCRTDLSVAPGDPIRSTGGGLSEAVVAAVDDRSSDEKNAVPI